jgi:hypothetical protein
MRRTAAVAAAFAAGLLLALAAPAVANDFAPQMRAYFREKVRPLLADPELVAAIKAQNARHAGLDAAAIEALDQQWRIEVRRGSGPLVGELMGRPASAKLRAFKQASGGVVVEIFLMDNKGLNVALSDVTSDYMQGDEPKWQRTFRVAPNAVFVDDVDFDESSKTFQAQISATVVDPAGGAAIGAVTVGLAVEKLP